MHKALHLRDGIDRLYVSRKEGRSWHTNFQDSINSSIQQLEDYIKKCEGRLINSDQKQCRQRKHQQNKNNQ